MVFIYHLAGNDATDLIVYNKIFAKIRANESPYQDHLIEQRIKKEMED